MGCGRQDTEINADYSKAREIQPERFMQNMNASSRLIGTDKREHRRNIGAERGINHSCSRPITCLFEENAG